MSARTRGELRNELHEAKFMAMAHTVTERQETWFRWKGSTREEVHMMFDAANNLHTWTVWHNTRTHIDQEPRLRDRLIAWLRPPAESEEST